jgi:hypothetical protein
MDLLLHSAHPNPSSQCDSVPGRGVDFVASGSRPREGFGSRSWEVGAGEMLCWISHRVLILERERERLKSQVRILST